MPTSRCETCRWYTPTTANGWDAAGDYKMYRLIDWLAEHGLRPGDGGWPGQCSQAPKAVEVLSRHGCSYWSIDTDAMQGINARVYDREQRNETVNLRKELKDERTRSRARYRQLREIRASKPKP